MFKSTKQIISSQQINTKSHRSSHGKNSVTITHILDAKLVEFGIDRARYHGGDLEGTSIVRLIKIQRKSSNDFLLKLIKSLLMKLKK